MPVSTLEKMDSPYLKNPNRLAEVIAAIQAMAVYKYYKMDFEGWADRIVGDKRQGEYWESIFKDHPEFFRLDQERKKASLVWRRNYNKNRHVETGEIISTEILRSLTADEQRKYSRSPLTNSDIQTLINSAINLSNIAEQSKKNRDWWKSAVFGLLGVVLGFAFEIIRKVFE